MTSYEFGDLYAEILKNRGDIPGLIRALSFDDDNRYLCYSAQRALVRIGSPAVEPLIAALSEDDDRIRERAAAALGELGDARAVNPLISALSDPCRSVRRAAAYGLANGLAHALIASGEVEFWEPIWGIYGELDCDTRCTVVDVLAEIGAPAVEPLSAVLLEHELHEDSPRMKAAKALGEIGDPRAVGPLCQKIREYDRGRAAYYALVKFGTSAVEPLCDLLRAHNGCWDAIRALEEIGDPRAVNALIIALGDPDSHTRGGIARALGTFGDTRAVVPLIAALEDPSSSTRSHAAYALGQIGDAGAVGALCKALNDSSEYVRRDAAEALGAIRDTSAVEVLCATLEDDSYPMVRKEAAKALGRIGDARAIGPLQAALKDSDEGVRHCAEEALIALREVQRSNPA